MRRMDFTDQLLYFGSEYLLGREDIGRQITQPHVGKYTQAPWLEHYTDAMKVLVGLQKVMLLVHAPEMYRWPFHPIAFRV